MWSRGLSSEVWPLSPERSGPESQRAAGFRSGAAEFWTKESKLQTGGSQVSSLTAVHTDLYLWFSEFAWRHFIAFIFFCISKWKWNPNFKNSKDQRRWMCDGECLSFHRLTLCSMSQWRCCQYWWAVREMKELLNIWWEKLLQRVPDYQGFVYTSLLMLKHCSALIRLDQTADWRLSGEFTDSLLLLEISCVSLTVEPNAWTTTHVYMSLWGFSCSPS